MDLWRGSLTAFLRKAGSRAIAGEMVAAFYGCHRHAPSDGEVASWKNSLPALAHALEPLARRDVGVRIGSGAEIGSAAAGAVAADRASDGPSVITEYSLPYVGTRMDVMLLGHDSASRAHAAIVELKQWSDVSLATPDVAAITNVLAHGRDTLHPCDQALGYANQLREYHSAFVDGGIAATPLAFCHNASGAAATAMRDVRFAPLLAEAPLFARGDATDLTAWIDARVGRGGGAALLDRVASGRFRPSRRVLDNLDDVLHRDARWHLLDEQRLAFNAIVEEVFRSSRRKKHPAVLLVRGGPGTGKTVIAVQLLKAALENRWKAVHATGGKAFTTVLRSKFKGADRLFIWTLNLRNAHTEKLDLVLVDEAHRIRKTSDTRFTPKAERDKKAQVDEILDSARVAVFFLDENQSMRPDEVGRTALIEEATLRRNLPLKTFDLVTQFRCSGSEEYVEWIDALLGFRAGGPAPWGARYDFALADRPEDLDRYLADASARGERARLLAGFCWEWSDANADSSLVDDVVIGEWRRPWNAKREEKTYKPHDDPYTLWAETPAGERQVGCIYSSQGFEFERVGVIWGNDLVWRGDRWVAQKKASHDRPVKGSTRMLELVRNAYRVLMTRGMLGTRLLILDPETRAHVAASLPKSE